MKTLKQFLTAVVALLITSAGVAAPGDVQKGAVTFARTAGGYTYLQVREGGKEVWLATTPLQVAVGEQVEYTGGDVMKQFHSQAMDRTFDAIRFVSRIHVVGRDAPAAATQGMPADKAHQGVGAARPAAPAKAEVIAKAKDGKTVAELYAQKDSLKGRNVVLRGRVAKFSKNILGKNWVTVVDGSGKAPDDKIVAITTGATSVGAVVTLSGELKTDVNLGSGYRYKVIVDEARLK